MSNKCFSVGAQRAVPQQGRFIVRALLLALLVVGTFASWGASAQEGTPEVTQPPGQPPGPSFVFLRFEPTTINPGVGATLTLLGDGFFSSGSAKPLLVRLNGFGVLQTTVASTNVITATVPETIPPGTYIVYIIEPGVGDSFTCTACSVTALSVLTPTNPPPPPTDPPPIPTQAPPPTPIPGAPNLLIRSFNANPSTIEPGGTVTFNVEIVNVGTRAAEGLSVSVDPGGKFIPANGQATILLPNLGPNGATVVNIPVTAAEDTPAGPQSVPITMTYRDFTGESYTAKGNLTVTVQKIETASQITLARYLFDPAQAEPGKQVTVTILLTNTGNEDAQQVLVRIGDGGLLLAGPEGDSFPVGDLAAGASASVEMPLIVSTSAKPGPQPQGFNITYLQDGESKQITSSVTVDVAKVVPTAPVLLLDRFDVGRAFLQPGEQFTAEVTLKNVGKEAAQNMLITFGTVSPGNTGGNNDDGTGGTGTGTGTGSGTTNPSTTFAPMGSGGTVFAGTVEADGGTVTLSQDFIVNSTVDTGIYTLPVTLRYQKPDGSSVTDILSASLVVVLPPRLSIDLQSPLPEETNIGEPLFLTLGITNRGRKAVNFTTATVTADNAEVVEGAETFLGPLRVDDDTSLSINVLPLEPGPVKVTVTLNYIDDLNKPQTIVKEYEVQAIEPPPLPTFEPPPDFAGNPFPQEEEQPSSDETLGKLLLGLLGLGS
ncbi:MAG: hypothetical protein HZC41_05145 [Chloroflexi bacterium]|nr:hypothetical protein [Chloroflexota bacterium]